MRPMLFAFAIALLCAQAHADPNKADCDEGTMDAASMDHFCPPGRKHAMVASGHCWHSGKYGFQSEWRRGKAKANGDCR